MGAPPQLDPDAVARVDTLLLERAASWTAGERAALVELFRRASAGSATDQLALMPADAVLQPSELDTLAKLRAEPAPANPSPHPSIVLIMKATRLCNLRCGYCHSWRAGPDQVMPFDILARTTRDALATPGIRHVQFTWHGGEVTLLPPAYLRKAIWLQEHFRRPDQHVTNTVQTNGTRLDHEWLALLRAYRITVGVSLDGPPEIHDRNRVDIHGRPTAAQVRRGLDQLREYGIAHGVLMVVGEDVIALGARATLDHLLDLGVGSVGLLNVIPENTPPGAGQRGQYLPWPSYVRWLRELFALWWPEHAGRLVIRELADLAGKVAGGGSLTCLFAGGCHGRYLTVEPSGEVSACDKYVDDPRYVFGGSLPEAFGGPALPEVRRREAAAVAALRDCRWFGVCAGGCPHDRRLSTQYLTGTGGCCGLAPLLDDMARARNTQPAPTAVPEEGNPS